MRSFLPRSGSRAGFTLIELLVVVAIIGILAAILLPALVRSIQNTKIKTARLQIAQIVQSLHSYQSSYGHYPVSANATVSVLPPNVAAPDDFTFGGAFRDANNNPISVNAPGTYQAPNAEVIATLMDLENYPNGAPTINLKHVKNTQQLKLLPATLVGDTTSPGVGSDGVYRDPWGNPYIITVDLNNDDKCRDAFYRLQTVSQQTPGNPSGYHGLSNTSDPGGNGDHFQYSGNVMVWSAGPDGKIDPSTDADHGVNRDNILSWKP